MSRMLLYTMANVFRTIFGQDNESMAWERFILFNKNHNGVYTSAGGGKQLLFTTSNLRKRTCNVMDLFYDIATTTKIRISPNRRQPI